MRFRTGRVFSFVGVAALLMPVGVGLSGCNNFFVCENKPACPSSGGGSGSGGGGGSTGSTGVGDWVYVANGAGGTSAINGYQIGTGTLTAISGAPFTVSYTPRAMVVSENNAFLYVASDPAGPSPGIYAYPINSTTGALGTGISVAPSQLVGAMAISPDGDYLFVVDPSVSALVTEFQMNSSTGALSAVLPPIGTTGAPLGCGLIPGTPVSPYCAIAVSPSGSFVGLSLNTNGTLIFPYSSSGGMLNYTGAIASPSSTSGDYSLAFDTNGYVFLGRSLELTSYNSLSSTPSQQGNYNSFPTNATPRSVVLASSSSYEYAFTADQGTNQISGFNVSSGGLTAQSSPTTAAPTYVSVLGVDRSGTYLLAAGYNSSNGLQMYTMASSGLTNVANEPTGTTTTVPVLMALTH